MFDMLDTETLSEILHDNLSPLDGRYVSDQASEIQKDLTRWFDDLYETRFIVIDAKTGNPVSTEAVLTKRETADELCRILGTDRHSVAILLVEQ